MDVMWAADRPCLVREVRERLSYDRPLAYTTVMTVMNILYGKGVLLREKHGRLWRYSPAESREEHDARRMTGVLRSGGDQAVTMLRFVERASDEEKEALRTAVRAGVLADLHKEGHLSAPNPPVTIGEALPEIPPGGQPKARSEAPSEEPSLVALDAFEKGVLSSSLPYAAKAAAIREHREQITRQLAELGISETPTFVKRAVRRYAGEQDTNAGRDAG